MVSEPPTAAAIADAVWDEAQSEHVSAGTFGLYLDSTVSGVSAPTAATVADAVWDETQSEHVGAGSFGAYLDASVSGISTSSSPFLLQTTTIATLASQTSFTLTAGSTDDDAYKDCIAVITDASTATQKAVGAISAYTGSSKTVTLSSDPGVFTMAATDNITIIAWSPSYIWSITPRTLTQSAGSVTATVAGTSITVYDATTWSISLTGLGSLASRTKLWFTAKKVKSAADTAAIIQIEETAGLIYSNGAAAGDSGNGSITVDDEAAGDITIKVEEAETGAISADNYYYDVKALISGDVNLITIGDFKVLDAVGEVVA
jgi:hypothetical protein